MHAVDLILKDHRTVEDLFEQFAKPEARRPIAERIVRELSVHAATEETRFYLALREGVPEGDSLVEQSLDEHRDTKEVLARVDDRMEKAHTKEFAGVMERLEKVVGHHVEEEESEILPRVQKLLTKNRLGEVSKAMAEAKASAPTHPHPAAPDEGIAAEVVGRASGVADRLRDRASGRPA